MTADGVAVRELGAGHEARWDEFVEGAAEATFFHKAGWKRVLERAFRHRCRYLYAERDGEIVGVLPLGQIKSRLFGNSLISVPFCAYGGVVAVDAAVRERLVDHAVSVAQALNVDYLELRNLSPQRADWASKDLYVTFRKQIEPDPDENLRAIPRKQRAMVRKGIEAGLTGELDTGVERFFRAYSESVRNLGTPVFPRRYFRILMEEFADDAEVLTIVRDGELIASVLSFYFRDQVLPYYGGGTAAARQVKGNDFMYWELMRRAAERGVRVFDYGRSKQGTGSFSFKKNWGFTPQPLSYEYKLLRLKQLPDVSPMNPKYRLFINLWKHLPVGVTRIIGPRIARNLG